MARSTRSESKNVAVIDSPRDRVLAAAELCIERHGIRKTTMEDIAQEAGMSRPAVYRYFDDREDLFIAIISVHTRLLLDKAHKFIARRDNLVDQIVDGVIYLAENGRQDPFTRYMVDLDGTDIGRRMVTSGMSETLVSEFWDPFLDAAVKAGTLPENLSRHDIHLWLRSLCLMIMRGLEDGQATSRRYRAILQTFIAPAFAV
jgi:AcrR family transcriptional regulator